jgi:hypothetical protein
MILIFFLEDNTSIVSGNLCIQEKFFMNDYLNGQMANDVSNEDLWKIEEQNAKTINMMY